MAVFPTGAINTRPAGASGSYSLRLNDDDSAYLSRTPSSAGNRKTWTWSGWVKRSNLSSNKYFFQARIDDTTAEGNKVTCYFMSNNKIRVLNQVTVWKETSAVFRDTSAWYHIVVRVDTTQSTASNRVRIYINGEEAAYDADNAPSQNADLAVNSTNAHYIGQEHGGYSYFDGYLADVYFIDGQSLAPSNFGETNSTYGNWQPITDGYTGTYGTNGFYLNFSDSGSIGTDSSGNSNDWTANNLASTDAVLDTPTNNFATFNSINVHTPNTSTAVHSQGNLEVSPNPSCHSTIGFSSGKYYAEFYFKSYTTGANAMVAGFTKTQIENGTYLSPLYEDGYGYYGAARKYPLGSAIGSWSSYGATYTSGDIIGVAIDADGGNLEFFKNGTSQGALSFTASAIEHIYFCVGSGSGNGEQTIVGNFGQDSSFAGSVTAQGNSDDNDIGDFYYTPPSNYLALCTANLPEPAVVPTENFNTVIWTGDDTNNRTISGVGFQPDLTFTSARDANGAHRQVYDAIGGYDKASSWVTNYGTSEGTEAIYYGGIGSVASDGFVTSSGVSGGGYEDAHINWNNYHYVAWNWLAGNGTSSNTTGSITSTVSVNQDAGLSVIAYDGTGSNATVGHGLSKAPEFIIIKDRDAGYDPIVYHHKNTSAPETDWLNLATDSATSDLNTVWNDTAPTSSVFSLGSNAGSNANGHTFACYCFHGVEGFSKFGSYIGNSVDDETFIYTGFRPAYILFKNASDSGSNWALQDSVREPYNPNNKTLYPSTSGVETESSNEDVDFLSNGFKIRTYSNDFMGGSGRTYIYAAFAEYPFKYTNAR